MSNKKITIENVRTGARKQVSELTWQLMSNPSNQGDVRKGYRLLEGIAGAQAPVKRNPAPTFVPPEIEEAARKKADADRMREAEMISGVKSEELESTTAATVVDSKEQAKDEASEGPSANSAELKALPGVTAKVLEVLAGIGITTAMQLAKANTADINKALAEANLGAKAAQVPGWKTKAAQLGTTNA